MVAIVAGLETSLALKADSTVAGWGVNSGVTNVPVGLSNVVAIAASLGSDLGLALKSDGTVVSWGDSAKHQIMPPGLSNVVAISAGDSVSMALRSDGTVAAWGLPQNGMSDFAGNLTNVIAIAVGYRHCAALINNGAPFIARQPLNQVYYAGANALITAGVVGTPPLGYQWLCNGTNLPGATNAWLTLTNVAVANQGSYSLVVSNQFGSVTSSNAALTVLRATPHFDSSPGSLQISANGLSMRLSGLSAHGLIIVYRSTNLVDWLPISTNPPVTGTLQILDPTVTNSLPRFYQAVEQ